jgi:hypothetical protein
VDSDLSHLCYLCQAIAWMGCGRSWPADMIAEQLGDFDDPRIYRDLGEAARASLVVQDGSGYQLTDAGFSIAAADDIGCAR